MVLSVHGVLLSQLLRWSGFVVMGGILNNTDESIQGLPADYVTAGYLQYNDYLYTRTHTYYLTIDKDL